MTVWHLRQLSQLCVVASIISIWSMVLALSIQKQLISILMLRLRPEVQIEVNVTLKGQTKIGAETVLTKWNLCGG